MKRNTLLVFGVAAALGCGAASATTFLCETDPADVSYKACAEIDAASFVALPSVGLVTAPALSPSTDLYVAAEPAFVTGSTVESRAHDSLTSEFWRLPGTATTTYGSPAWLPSEPAVVTYYYFDSALDGIR